MSLETAGFYFWTNQLRQPDEEAAVYERSVLSAEENSTASLSSGTLVPPAAAAAGNCCVCLSAGQTDMSV